MDELSYYGTIASIILIHLSYYWYYRNDHYTRKLNGQEIEDAKLVVVLVNCCNGQNRTNNNSNMRLKEELERVNFNIFSIQFVKELIDITIDDEFNIRIDPTSEEQKNRAFKFIENQLNLNNLKLYAYITNLNHQVADESLTVDKVLTSIQYNVVPSVKLLLSFSNLIFKDKTKVIKIFNQSNGNFNEPCSLKFDYHLQKAIDQFLLGQKFDHCINVEIKALSRQDDKLFESDSTNLECDERFLINVKMNNLRKYKEKIDGRTNDLLYNLIMRVNVEKRKYTIC